MTCPDAFLGARLQIFWHRLLRRTLQRLVILMSSCHRNTEHIFSVSAPPVALPSFAEKLPESIAFIFGCLFLRQIQDMFLYRIISIIVNIFCAFVALATLWGLVLALANPVFLFQCFLTAGTVLYAWFANRFYHTVVVAKKIMTKKQKDWLQVNAIVALIFSLLGISNTVTLLTHPKMRDDMLSAMPANLSIPQSTITNVAVFMLVICIILLVHIAMTYSLIKKYKEYFETGS